MTVISVSPAKVTAGSATLALTVNGTGFTSSTAAQVGTVVETTSFVSSTQLTASVPASQLASGSFLNVVAVNGTATSGSGTAVTLEVDNPVPTITSFAPASFLTGATPTTVTVTGTGFVPTTVIQVTGVSRATTYVSSTQVSVLLTATDLATAGNVTLTAVNAAPGGGTSSAASIAVNNPVPTLASLSPSTVLVGATTPSTITLTGTNFLSSSTVLVGTSSRTPTFVSSTQLTVALSAADQTTAGKLSISVVNPSPGGGTSNIVNLAVATPTPTPVLTAVNPTSLIVGSGPSYIAVSGTNLTASTVVLWNGTPLVTTAYYYGSTIYYLSGAVPAALLATAGTASITTTTPTAIQPISNALPLSIVNPPPPMLTYISPASGPIQTAQTLTLTGTGFTAASTVALNGTTVTSTYGNSTSITVALTASQLALPGNYNFTVTTPAPGGGTSSAIPFTAYIGIANNSMVYNPVNGLLYVSVPSSAGAPYGNSVVSVDPATGALGTPIFVGSEPNKLAISSDGTILWVGLDGAAAVRQVNLTTGTAGLQFGLGANGSAYATPATAIALAALPGSPNSVVVSSTNQYPSLNLAIYDSGVIRGAANTSYYYSEPSALQVNGSTGEVYAASQSNYTTYTYSSTGLTLKASASNGTYANYNSGDDLQLAGGVIYTDSGGAYDAESGSLLGTFYSSGSTAANGPTVADTTLGKVFILDNSTAYSYGSYNQIQVFNLSTYNQASSSVIPISVNTTSTTGTSYANHLTRWGTNGLAMRTSSGVYSVRSNLVKDLSSTSADLSLAIAATGSNTTGANTTYTATISNAGPAASTNIAFNASLPSTGVLVSVQPSTGTCSTSSTVSCDLGGLANGATATVTIVVQQTAPGASALSGQVNGSETDPNLANNAASATATITGSAYNLVPTVTSIAPASILAGSTDTVLTVNGTGFVSSSAIQVGGTVLSTTFVSATQLTATVPATALATLGWKPVTVSTPTPGGGTANVLPLSIYSVITLGVNHILYDPYSRNIMASVGSGSSSVAGNSIVAITPDTATVGSPVNIGSQPTNLALTSDGQILYTVLTGSDSVARYNMLTQAADFTFTPPSGSNYFTNTLQGVATQPGTENTVALDLGEYNGTALYDFNPTAKTAAIRGQATGTYTASCPQFLDAGDLLASSSLGSFSLIDYTVTSTGFTTNTSSSLNHFGCFKLSNGLAFSIGGGVANPTTVPATQLGYFQAVASAGVYSNNQALIPDASLQRAFYVASTTGSTSFGTFDGVSAYNINTFLPSGAVTLNVPTTEGTNSNYTAVDLIRWGQDGLALLTSGGHIYLLRGAFVVPQLLTTNTAAVLTSSSTSTITHGVGNTLLTLTGSNFLPGVAVTWNGSYRTTTIVDATHVTVAIPASDLSATGSGSLIATNPGAPASSAITVTVN